jgi:DNA-binding GntR family transcriptional regulator
LHTLPSCSIGLWDKYFRKKYKLGGNTGVFAFLSVGGALQNKKFPVSQFPVNQLSVQKRKNENMQIEKAPMMVIRKIRNAILDEIFKPGDWLPELELAKRFQVSRSPIREALQALEKEGTVTTEPYKGAIVKPVSADEALDIAEIRLALITLATKAAYRHLSASDFDLAYALAKQITRCNNAKEHFACSRQFWDVIFEKAQRPILQEVFRRLEDQSLRYEPLIMKILPNAATRPRQREVLIESYRKGRVDEALRAFKKIDFEVVQQIVGYLEITEADNTRS